MVNVAWEISLASQLVHDRDGPPDVGMDTLDATAGGEAKRANLCSHSQAMFRWLQSVARKEAQERYRKWGHLKEVKEARRAAPRAAAKDWGPERVKKGGGAISMGNLGNLQPPLEPFN